MLEKQEDDLHRLKKQDELSERQEGIVAVLE